MAYAQARIYSVGPGSITPVPYAETEHFRITRDILSHPKRSLKILLNPPFMT